MLRKFYSTFYNNLINFSFNVNKYYINENLITNENINYLNNGKKQFEIEK